MKKIYLTPAMEVMNTNVESVICTSPLNINRNSETKVTGESMDAKRRGIFGGDDAESSNGIW